MTAVKTTLLLTSKNPLNITSNLLNDEQLRQFRQLTEVGWKQSTTSCTFGKVASKY